ncbi:hypothetical protein [Clostridium sp. D33t1_170424_F3]|uniref:hypothetical protein n=1 Tax=Clostridium sp. D33t1_170424_F3 TaxID=2787099 RepID=UPI0018AAAE79|nr:hypothetical protein [Clostridium sp. D33t1_170424_F3]
MNNRQLLTQLNTVRNAVLTYQRMQNTSFQVENLLRQAGWAAGYMQDIRALRSAVRQIQCTMAHVRRGRR